MPELIDLSSIKAENTQIRKQAVASVVSTLRNEFPSLNGFIGPMRGGKTTAATETYEAMIAEGRTMLVAKMDFDQRGDADYTQVWTRERNKSSYMDAFVIKGINDLTALLHSESSPVTSGDIITLIEAPFMEKRPGEIDTFLRTAREKGVSIVVDGLVSWYNGVPIPQMQTILRNPYYE